MAAAEHIPGLEIVAVDSMQVYRGMDIGTAKPTAHERVRVRHHGLDLAEPDDDFTVVRFVEAFDRAVASAGGPLLAVAGTGLYLRAVLDRFEPPGQWPELKDELLNDPDLGGLFQRLLTVDPVAAGRIDPGNRRRIVRALEVSIGGGRPFSSYGPGLDAYPPIDTLQIGLRWPRESLWRRVNQRVDEMMAGGLLEEVAVLGRARLSRTAQQALGYRELLDYLDGVGSLHETVELIKLRTRQFAVRQERWFRRDPRIRWIDVTSDPLVALPEVVAVIESSCA